MTGAELPVWISDFVLLTYGSGAIMAVPAHDERDYAFARKFGLPVVPVISSPRAGILPRPPTRHAGRMINSGPLNGLDVHAAIPAVGWLAEENGVGKAPSLTTCAIGSSAASIIGASRSP